MRFLLFFFVSLSGFAADFSAPLQRLMDGNSRYMKDQTENLDRNSYRRQEVAKKQQPFAIIVGCSDSRVPPEIVFDQGIGDLFIVRVAGNVVGPLELDSIEYATEYLGSVLLVVLGHEACGAVSTVFNGELDDIEDIAQLILPAIQNIKPRTVEEAVKANVRSVVNYLNQTTSLKKLIAEGNLEVRGAYYHLRSGQVELL